MPRTTSSPKRSTLVCCVGYGLEPCYHQYTDEFFWRIGCTGTIFAWTCKELADHDHNMAINSAAKMLVDDGTAAYCRLLYFCHGRLYHARLFLYLKCHQLKKNHSFDATLLSLNHTYHIITWNIMKWQLTIQTFREMCQLNNFILGILINQLIISSIITVNKQQK